MSVPICEFCGEPTSRTLPLNDGFTGHLCAGCDVLFTNASHAFEERESVNESFYPLTERLAIYRNRREELRSRYLEVEKFIRSHVDATPLSVLEIGSNVGSFAAQMRERGINVETVEVNPTLREYQVRERSLICYPHVQDIPPGRHYNVVVFMDVLEHIPQPIEVLKQVRSLLSDAGVVFLQFPNKNSLIASVAKSRWSWWSAPDHLYHFSTRGVDRLAARAGYECRSVRTLSPVLDDLTQVPGLGLLARAVFRLAGKWNVNPLVEFSRGSLIQAVLRPIEMAPEI